MNELLRAVTCPLSGVSMASMAKSKETIKEGEFTRNTSVLFLFNQTEICFFLSFKRTVCNSPNLKFLSCPQVFNIFFINKTSNLVS